MIHAIWVFLYMKIFRATFLEALFKWYNSPNLIRIIINQMLLTWKNYENISFQ